MHFSGITEVQFGKNSIHCSYFKAFEFYCCLPVVTSEKCVVTPIFFFNFGFK